MTSQNILVTGGAGFIGSHLAEELIKCGHNVTVFDNLNSTSHPDGKFDIPKDSNFVKGDVRNYGQLKESIKDIDIVYHLAARVGILQSNYKIKDFVESNVQGTANLLDILVNQKHNVKKVIIAASNTSYGEGLYKCQDCGVFHPDIRTEKEVEKYGFEMTCPKCRKVATPIPTNEDTQLKCNSIYSMSKRDQEDFALLLGRMYGIPTTVLRLFNVYGPRQSLSNPYTGVSAIFSSNIKNNNAPKVYEDGLQTRDFVSVYDVTRANILCLKSKISDYETFNVGTGKPIKIIDLAYELIKIHKKKNKAANSQKI